MSIVVGRFIEVRDLPSRLVREQDFRPFELPPVAYPGQDQSSLHAGLGGASLGRLGHDLVVPPVRLIHYTIENGCFLVGHRLDGTVLTSDGRPVIQTAAFRDLRDAGQQDATVVDTGPVRELGEVFVGFDGAWRNYFHWLCFALVKSFIGARLMDPSVTIALPDYDPNTTERPASFSRTVFDQSIALAGLTDRVTLLPPGAYRAARIHLLWTSPGEPTDIMHLNEFRDVFQVIGTGIEAEAPSGPYAGSPRVYLARSRFVASRLDDAVSDMIDAAASRHGFETVSFEGLDLRQQVAVIRNATHLMSPHGAGLSNMLFGRSRLKVFELNKPLDGGRSLRPWFLVAARAGRLDYRYLDTGDPLLDFDRIDAALTGFLGLG